MEGYINNEGVLLIKRKDRSIKALCPYLKVTSFDKDCKPISTPCECRDSCALFGEPVAEMMDNNSDNMLKPSEIVSTGRVILQLCEKDLIFDKFEDLRS